MLGEGEEFEEGDVGGPGASLREGWALLHAKEAAQGCVTFFKIVYMRGGSGNPFFFFCLENIKMSTSSSRPHLEKQQSPHPATTPVLGRPLPPPPAPAALPCPGR